MKKLFSLLLIVLSFAAHAQPPNYVPANPGALKIGVNVNGTLKQITIADLTKDKLDKSKHTTDSSTLKALIDANTSSLSNTQIFDPAAKVETSKYSNDSTATKGLIDARSQVVKYTIEKVGSSYYARPAPNTSLTAIVSTNFNTVMQGAIQYLRTPTTRGSGGGRIILGDGQFNLTDTIGITGWENQGLSNPGYSQIVIQGQGKSTLLYQNTAGKDAIIIHNNASIGLLDMRIECSSNSGRSAVRFASDGVDEISAFGVKMDNLYLINSSSTYPALYMSNFFDVYSGTLTAQNPSGNAIWMENVSTTTLYGNSHFNFIRAIASSASGYAGLKVTSTDGGNYHSLDLISISNYECVSGYYGVNIIDGSNFSFGMVDIEYGTIGFHIGGGTFARHTTVSSGYISVNATTGTDIEITSGAGGNSFVNVTLGGGTSVKPITDSQQFLPPNLYDVVLFNDNAANISITSASRTFLRYKSTATGRTYTFFGDNTNATTQTAGDNTTALATTAFVTTAVSTKANTASPVLTGTVTLPAIKLTRTGVADANKTMAVTDYMTCFTSLTATRTVTIPAASGATNLHYVIKDESGQAGSFNITIIGTVNGVVNPTAINTAYGVYRFYSNGTAWFSE